MSKYMAPRPVHSTQAGEEQITKQSSNAYGPAWTGEMEIAEFRILANMASRASLSSSLVNNLHCCRNIQVLNKQSAGLAGKTCSIVNLFLVVHKDQHMAAKPTQNNLLWAPTKELAKMRRSEK